jgi:hypothetical protein
MAQAIRTVDHLEIKNWVEERGGVPGIMPGTQDGGGPGILQIDWGGGDEDIQEVGWEEFFRIFDTNELALVYEADDAVDAEGWYAYKFVPRNTEIAEELPDDYWPQEY